MDNVIEEKIKIGISSCQFGSRGRYNGKGLDARRLLGRERADFIWHPVCPEVLSGMGVPRNPVSLRGGNGDDFWDGTADIKSRSGVNMNEWMREGCVASLDSLTRAGVRVFIFMEGSPSCGVYRTSLKNKRLGHPPGIFGSLLLREGFFLIPSNDLQSPIRWWDWRRRMFAFVWLLEKPFDSAQEVVDSWHIRKFLCQELSRKEADDIGKTIANLKGVSADELALLKRRMLDLLRRPSDIRKIKQSLWKNYAFLRKRFGIESGSVAEPADERSMTRIAGELLSLEILTARSDVLFGASPIHYRVVRKAHEEEAELDEDLGEAPEKLDT